MSLLDDARARLQTATDDLNAALRETEEVFAALDLGTRIEVPLSGPCCQEVMRCPLACPHGDRCTLPRGHDGGHNHRGCDCNEPDQPPCDQCGERKPAELHVHGTAGRKP